MNRRETLRFIREKILPGAEISITDWHTYGHNIMNDIIIGIGKWRVGKPVDIQMNARIIDGVLYINDEPVRRVASKMQKGVMIAESARCNYYEGRCIGEYDF